MASRKETAKKSGCKKKTKSVLKKPLKRALGPIWETVSEKKTPNVSTESSKIEPSKTHQSDNKPRDKGIVQALQYVETGCFDDARKAFKQTIEREPANAQALHGLGLVAYMQKDYEPATEMFKRALQIEPKNPQFLSNLGEGLRRSGHLEEALEAFYKSQLYMPEFLLAHLGYGNTLRDLGRFEEAISRFRLILAINSNFSEAYHYLGVTLKDQGDAQNALPLLRKAVALRPDYSEAIMSLATVLEGTGATKEALESYYKLLERNPDDTAICNNIGNILKTMGRMDEAVDYYRRALINDPDHVPAYYNLSHAQKGAPHDEIKRMETILAAPDLSQEKRCNLHFALGKIYDDNSEYGKAFWHIQKGNKIDDRGAIFSAANHTRAIDRIIDTFSNDFFQARSGMGCESKIPVFIVGMPRSGTTLVEQCISAHPNVFGAGELDFIGRTIASIPETIGSVDGYPEFALSIDAINSCRLGEDYIAKIRRLGGDAERITDKMPGNFVNLGFIAQMLPKARIIHCRRNPLDVCLSCYFQHFTSVMPFSKNLETLGQFYRDYDRLMTHWKSVLPMPILEVQYENMVSDQELTIRNIVEFSGLEWDNVCLEFYKTDRQVKTASSWQVRQPLYSTSVERWRHYEDHIAALKKSLGDVLV